jgi:peptidoglycan/xylan/chitin deacetylase (PgdA/CDA1 family)
VPVLMYHSIADPPPGALYPGLYVSPDAFKAQMQALHDAGWQSITAGELGAAMAADRPVPVRTIVIMFDDGYADNYLVAFPILESYGFRATFSVVASGGSSMMTSQQLATMVQAGMEIGNHTLNHRNVSHLTGPTLEGQIQGGALRIEARLATQGITVDPRTFVYPSGHVGPAALALLAQLGYTDAFTEVPGFAVIGQTPPLQIPRVRVSRFETLAEFIARLPVEPRP